jgi:hypothetical protein
MITITPDDKPDAPIPAIARPTIKTVEDGAAPDTTDPISNSRIAARNTHLGE